MAKLTTAERKKIPASQFAGPDRSYPIEDASHARNALARVSQHGSPEEKAKVRSAVHSKYPDIGQQSLVGEGKKKKKTHAQIMYPDKDKDKM